jgi:NAD(P)-dependent dehydrogenase (short-subunit alcohol dehydrogenase family)
MDTMDMSQRVLLVIGGTGAIGSATARAFAKRGAGTVIAGRDSAKGDRLVREIARTGAKSVFVEADVTDTSSIENAVALAVAEFGRIDYAFNNAGWEGTAQRVADIEEADWNRMLDIKLSGVWRGLRCELRQFQKQAEGGAIVNMAGTWGLVGFPRYSSYCAAAHGIMGLTKAAAMEYGREGIRINAVCPAAVDTPLLDRIFGGNAQAKEQFGQQLVAGRVANPDEVAQAVLWLCSAAASYVNGEALVLNGGG